MGEIHYHININLPGEGRVSDDQILAAINHLRRHMEQSLQDLNTKLDKILGQTGDYIAYRDRVDAEFNATIADLQAKLDAALANDAADAAAIQEFRDGVAAASTKADAAIAAIPVPPGVVVPETPPA